MKYKPSHRTIVCGIVRNPRNASRVHASAKAPLSPHSRMFHHRRFRGVVLIRGLSCILPLTKNITTKSIDMVGARGYGRFRDYDPGKIHRVTLGVTHRRNIAIIKTFGGYPAARMGFYPTVNSRFAKTDGETLRAACILFADLTNSRFPPSCSSPRMRTHAARVSDSSATPLASSKELRVSLFFPSPQPRSRSSHTNRITAAFPTTPVSSILRARRIRIGEITAMQRTRRRR